MLTKTQPATDGREFAERLLAAGFPADRIVFSPNPTAEQLTTFAADAASFVIFYSGHGILLHTSMVARIWQPGDRQTTGLDGQPEVSLPAGIARFRCLPDKQVEFS